jgi:hypothetical protein
MGADRYRGEQATGRRASPPFTIKQIKRPGRQVTNPE